MSLNNIIRKASSLLGISDKSLTKLQYEDGDIVFSKNNVCVHTPSQYRGDGSNVHHPGYMVVRCLCVTTDKKTLTLSWIPNEKLKRSHELIQNGKNDGSSNLVTSQNNTGIDAYSNVNSEENEIENCEEPLPKKINESNPQIIKSNESNNFDISSLSSLSLTATTTSEELNNYGDSTGKSFSYSNSNTSGVFSADEESKKESNSDGQIPLKHQELEDPKARYISSSSDSSLDNGRHSKECSSAVAETSESSVQVESNNSEDEISIDSSTGLQASPPPRYFSAKARDQWYDRSAESMAYSANLAFPESPSNVSSLSPTPLEGGSSPVRRLHKCGIFSVDIGLMKSLRLFFSDKEKTCGQLVIASEESQYKILHFHHGGLDKLATVFEDWNFLVDPSEQLCHKELESPSDIALKQFSICRARIQECEMHPEEGSHEFLDAESWVTYFTEEGMIDEELSLRRTIFFGGVEPQLRTNVWPFLLHYYDFRTTFIERQTIMEEKHQLYFKINSARKGLVGPEKDNFWKDIQCTVEKDVVRTDRTKRCFQGPDNPNIEKMKNILLNFAYYNPEIGYTQGMSDIVAPILSEVRNEADVFWCFTGMMSKTIFVTSPRDQDMEMNLRYLCELLRLIVPSFYDYVCTQEDGKDLLFCHRWILLCFKREFAEDQVLSMWEACWAHYQTDFFHLFLVVAIVSVYGLEVVRQSMRPDEMLLYFTSLANHMDGTVVLKKARGLLHQFRIKDRIPCTLVGLCELCGPGMWDSGHAPTVECAGHDGDSSGSCLVAQKVISGVPM